MLLLLDKTGAVLDVTPNMKFVKHNGLGAVVLCGSGDAEGILGSDDMTIWTLGMYHATAEVEEVPDEISKYRYVDGEFIRVPNDLDEIKERLKEITNKIDGKTDPETEALAQAARILLGEEA